MHREELARKIGHLSLTTPRSEELHRELVRRRIVKPGYLAPIRW
jgi:hypothetical protein